MSDEQLEEFFKQEDLTLIVDVSNIAHNTLHAVIYTSPDDNGKFELWRSAFVNCIFSNIQKFAPQKLILAEDAHNNWRYDIYPEYKWERKLKKKESEIKYDIFYEVLNNVLDDIKQTFTNIISLKVDRCEADDIISVLSREIKDDNIIILSSDRDFHQLLVSQRIKQFKPITKEFVECINPSKSLQLKILTGDKGDSILGVKPKVGPKTAAKILQSGLEEFLDTDKKIRENYDRNKKLIDLKEIPSEYCEKIINTFNNYQISPLNMDKVFRFFNKHRLQMILNNWNAQGKYIKSLYNFGVKET
jgi:5'-3' exonuclease